MKRIIIPFVAAFGLSLGIATGVVIMRAPKASPIVPGKVASAVTKPADSTAAVRDSGAAKVADSSSAADTTRTALAATTGAKAPAGAVAPTKSDKSAAGSTAKPQQAPATPTKLASASSPVRAAGPPPPRPISDSLIGRRLAQVFAAMQPKDAARVLEQMGDSDVRAILGSLSSKQQAAILGSFPTQRAALIVQATLRTASNGGSE